MSSISILKEQDGIATVLVVINDKEYEQDIFLPASGRDKILTKYLKDYEDGLNQVATEELPAQPTLQSTEEPPKKSWLNKLLRRS